MPTATATTIIELGILDSASDITGIADDVFDNLIYILTDNVLASNGNGEGTANHAIAFGPRRHQQLDIWEFGPCGHQRYWYTGSMAGGAGRAQV